MQTYLQACARVARHKVPAHLLTSSCKRWRMPFFYWACCLWQGNARGLGFSLAAAHKRLPIRSCVGPGAAGSSGLPEPGVASASAQAAADFLYSRRVPDPPDATRLPSCRPW